MFSNVLSAVTNIFPGARTPKKKIALWGVDVDRLTTLASLLKTGDYADKTGSIHPAVIENVTINDTVFDIVIPSANEGSRRSFRSLLESFDGIVFVHSFSSINTECLVGSSNELKGLLEDEKIRGTNIPILIVLERHADQSREGKPISEIAREYRIGDENVKILTFSTGNKAAKDEFSEGFDWLFIRCTSS